MSLSEMKLLLATPTYGPVDPRCAKDLRVAMMTCMNAGVRWAGDASPDRMGWSAGRTAVALNLMAMPESVNGIMWVDSDMRQEPDDMLRLLSSVVDFKADFVTGVYHKRIAPHEPTFYMYDRQTGDFRSCEQYPDNVFAPIDGCGFGFVYTSRKLIEKIAELPSFNEEIGWFPDTRDVKGGYGEDMGFCKHAMDAKIQLYVNTGIQLGHMGDPEAIYRKHYEHYKNKVRVK